MAQVKVIVLRTAGTNCDAETCHGFELAGAHAESVHVNRLIAEPGLLNDYHILSLPGGFSYGDDISAGRILANQLVHHFREEVERFIAADKLVLGICNGFQVLVKAGLLPGGSVTSDDALPGPQSSLADQSDPEPGHVAQNNAHAARGDTQEAATNRQPSRIGQQATIAHNDSGRFEDRWVYLEPQTRKCVFIEPGRRIYLPIAHGEGKVVTKTTAVLDKLKSDKQIAFKYVDKNGEQAPYPVNPNGSVDSIAGLTDSTGRVLGLMPHPERFVRPTHHPHWSRLKDKQDSDGMTIFTNAVKFIQQNF